MSTDDHAEAFDEFDQWRRLTLMVGQLNQALEKTLAREYRVSLPETLVLAELRHSPEHAARLQELAARVGLDQSSMSRLVTRLEHKGLAARATCQHDRRGVYCMLTPEGAERGEQAEARCRAELSKLLRIASFDDRWAPLVASFRFGAAAESAAA
ncbi:MULTISPECIES: MarR family winged helix-turn-helix transcriptional regulator [Streptomyces]|jgi:DNA-binding MarR family transcriptional regulator|uniref:MarR family transcriptional regulator n=1 Tax=Streptomyces thermoviolaceus subsp. thermoviolaceus TaxID=66860 RepID=A0ABX0Z0W1_STRTL|nr:MULTISPECIES: MarR family transcriptional regulator [Streptomyces]MCM3265206.1 MarR family transcriptional regulator [Streptomyces thermoviolaceus]NJP16981.1 MarR family transcriptional regulator [Streptomyces thermoviolaceus subsp. thermoviolaceus]RSR97916.1 MarR family transcriptional regulator [Streptomyces sp. WAC00469]WTD46798.1 MarR family transcriptional regulator [Streptomyces thermoviolaceus]GGV72278.1 MarR family transcriptional regulator [Streptomyces thermoviolaceus subsp. aping